MVGLLQGSFDVSERRACRVLGFSRTTQRRKSPTRVKDLVLVERLRTLAAERPRFGYRRLYLLLRRDGLKINHKRVYRVYRAEGLAVRQNARRKLALGERQQKPVVSAPNQRWSLDVMADQLASGQRFRVLNVVDDFTRECLVMHASVSITGHDVIRHLADVIRFRGCPVSIITDNGPQCSGKALDLWTHETGIHHLFIRPGTPVENTYIESFNGRVRDECLNVHWFQSLEQARVVLSTWRVDDNQVRPHTSLGGRSPNEFARLIQVG
ncbi:IS3 family transposase [Deinococcus sp. KSM4-11]|uniref:IS3 family transposase n=1 Tax=Deinococcus sp. KSM4-11 TaxID=2568654 RepID=UPI0010A308F7|nr:IS3 family transposase [Deinococcus sp. KSM4-11]THF87270.1 IS3 family transposase [Deinococcus sp. KSM4-11]